MIFIKCSLGTLHRKNIYLMICLSEAILKQNQFGVFIHMVNCVSYGYVCFFM